MLGSFQKIQNKGKESALILLIAQTDNKNIKSKWKKQFKDKDNLVVKQDKKKIRN